MWTFTIFVGVAAGPHDLSILLSVIQVRGGNGKQYNACHSCKCQCMHLQLEDWYS